MEEVLRIFANHDREMRQPRRPMSAYNLFFKSERVRLIQENRGVGFSDMAREIAANWMALDSNERKVFEEEAIHQKWRYRVAISEWRAHRRAKSNV